MSNITQFVNTTYKPQPEDIKNCFIGYLTETCHIALAYGAAIDRLVGDAILIFPVDTEMRSVEEDATVGVQMAPPTRKRLMELQHAGMDAGIESPWRCRVGIGTGLCTVRNFGSETRMDCTIIGSAVNLAARLETACPPGDVLVCDETHA